MYGGMGSYGMGGYGGMNSFGGGMYGQPGFGAGYGGMPGPGMVGPDGVSLTQRMESGTQATFQILESVVGAFGGFAQMLESTYMATHSSFFAMIGVAEQFGSLRNYLGQVLSVFTLIRWVKGLIARLTGSAPPPPSAAAVAKAGLTPESFQAFASGQPLPPAPHQGPKPSKKPIFIFFLTVIGLPYLMGKLVKMITARQEEEMRQRGIAPNGGLPHQAFGPDGRPLPQPEIIDPASLTFVRATFPFTATSEAELTFNANDIIAVLTPQSERAMSGWWRGRLRDGRIGFFPNTCVTVCCCADP